MQTNNIPALRFKEFTEEWYIKRADEILERYSNPVEVNKDQEYYQIGIRSHGKGIFHKEPVSGKELGNKRVFWIGEELFVVNIVFAWEHAIALTGPKESGMIASHRFPMYKSKGDLVSEDFIWRFFSRKRGKYLLQMASPGGAGRNKTLGQQNFNELKVTFPSLPEQQKIAAFLSAVDKKLSQLKRKKALLEQYKKGVMQKLFSRELRFKNKEGNDYPDWEECLYGDIFSFYSTNSLSREKLNYDCGEVRNIHYGDIHTEFASQFNILKEQVPFINSDIELKKIKKESYCQEGDLVIADASEDYSDIGKSIELIDLNGEMVLAGLHTFLARPAKGAMYVGFSGYLVQADYVRKQIMVIAQGTKVLGLATSRLAKVKLQIPPLPEQQKIANYLSAMDTKIAAVDKQISQTEQFKKGLLQQMFV